MTTTRKIDIIKKFGILEEFVKLHVQSSLFPNLDDYSTGDLVYFITLIFMGVESEIQFCEKVKLLANLNNFDLNDSTVDIILPNIIEFVIWLRNL